MEFSDLLVILGSFQNIFNFCVSQKLLASCQQCSRRCCNMELTETTQVKDGCMWRCTNKRCRMWLSIRSGSFFEGSNIMLSSWLHLMFLWAIQISGSRIARLTSLSKPTVVRALGELRTICSNKVLNAGIKIGGLGKTVEIDESKFGAKRKYKRGRVSEGPWVFGVVERGSQKVLLFRVPDRTRETLVHRLITTHIQPGTVIYSNQFTLYIPLNQLGYIHVSRTLLTPTVVHTPIPSKACGPWSRKS
ncbi:uncharacterized protein LOC141859458 [Acropora palmata]|uniref:uncharacterized protein LOC141859458 n=1 Tax=Acropora palmata TaxID=6131 RepID=UPI003DA0BB95